eukprot:TRINITY_DN4974_c0_g1_i1.p1 TRINITY_DN4974_c0_g1~~TRINITY_DN4974_c0_g1_i1.p1  ORF type:complete len:517 (-),score=106.25 TRINITY_DN4974_c0_g1_i1:447-1796(-)
MGSANSEAELLLAISTLKELLLFLKPSMILERYASAMERGLSKETHVQVKIMVVKTLQRMKSEEIGPYKSILSLATETIEDPELSLAKETINFLLNIASEKMDLLFSDSIYPILLRILDSSSKDVTNQLRVYELFIRIGSVSQELLNRIVESRILNRLLKLAYSDDVLVKVNALELLGDLAQSPQGYQYIVKDSGMSSKLDDLLDMSNEPLSAIVLPGIIKFFGNLAYVEPKLILSNHPKFLGFLSSGLRNEDKGDPVYKASIETLGLIVRTSKGREAIGDCFNVSEVLTPLTHDIRSGRSEMKIFAMEIFADFVNSGEDSALHAFNLLEDGSDKPASSVLLQILKLPFEDEAAGGYRLLGIISQYAWGIKAISEHSGFIEFILNRDNGRSKYAKQMKHRVIGNILTHGGDSSVLVQDFGTPIVIKMKEYVRDGPYYVQSEANVAYEEG